MSYKSFSNKTNSKPAHAFLGASKHSWLNYDEERLVQAFQREQAKLLGTELHEWAAWTIQLGRKQPDNDDTVNMYINDAIGFHMDVEQRLEYSDICFGTADAISFRKNMLRIHDLKTGTVVEPHMDQLIIYAALYCLCNGIRPGDIQMELRLYWMNDKIIFEPGIEDVAPVMDKIVRFDQIIHELIQEG